MFAFTEHSNSDALKKSSWCTDTTDVIQVMWFSAVSTQMTFLCSAFHATWGFLTFTQQRNNPFLSCNDDDEDDEGWFLWHFLSRNFSSSTSNTLHERGRIYNTHNHLTVWLFVCSADPETHLNLQLTVFSHDPHLILDNRKWHHHHHHDHTMTVRWCIIP